ncbi:MAG: hypothetical protein ACJ78J_04275 [Gemmatimonadaceae bacterium]
MSLGPRSAVNIEYRTAAAFSADQPVTLSRITQAEGTAANFATRHCDAAPRADGRFAGHELGTDLFQLALTVLRGIVGH